MRKLTVPICICFTIITLISSASNAAANTITANCTMVAGPTKGTIQQFVIDLASGKMNLNGVSLNARSLNHLILLTAPGDSKPLMFFDRKSGEFKGDHLGKIGDCEFKNISPIHTQSVPPSVYGKMQCRITGQKVLGSQNGKTEEYTGFQGGWSVDDPLELIYQVPSDGDFCLTLQKPGHKHCTSYEPDVNPFTAVIPFAMLKKRLATKSLVAVGWKDKFSLILTPSKIQSSNSEGRTNLTLTQYSEGNWDGVYTEFLITTPQKYVRVFTFDCRSSGDNAQKFTNSMYTKFK